MAGEKQKILIVGFGNPLRGDDHLAWEAVRQLERAPGIAGAEFVTCHQLTPELAEPLAQADLAVFIDASEDEPPGALRLRQVTPGTEMTISSSHDFSPSSLLTYAQALYGGIPEETWLATLGGENFGYREGLSSCIQAKLPELVQQVAELVRSRSD